jgi:hypothetical protein
MSALSGGVADRPFALTVYSLAARQFSGDLVLEQKGKSYSVTFSHGQIVAATSPEAGDNIARVAIKAGLINTSHAQAFLTLQKKDSQRDSAELLGEVAKLNEEQVSALRRRATGLAAARIFALPEATFEITATNVEQESGVVGIHWLIYFGVRTYYTMERLKGELGALSGKQIMLRDAAKPFLRGFGFGDSELTLVRVLAESAKNVRAIAEALPTMDRHMLLSVLYALYSTSCLELDGKRSKGASFAPPVAAAGNGEVQTEAEKVAEAEKAAEAEIRRMTGAAAPTQNPPAAAQPPTARATAPTKPAVARPSAPTVRASTGAPKANPAQGSRRVSVKKRAGMSGREIEDLIQKKLVQLDAGVDHYTLFDVKKGCSPGPPQSCRGVDARSRQPATLCKNQHCLWSLERPEETRALQESNGCRWRGSLSQATGRAGEESLQHLRSRRALSRR